MCMNFIMFRMRTKNIFDLSAQKQYLHVRHLIFTPSYAPPSQGAPAASALYMATSPTQSSDHNAVYRWRHRAAVWTAFEEPVCAGLHLSAEYYSGIWHCRVCNGKQARVPLMSPALRTVGAMQFAWSFCDLCPGLMVSVNLVTRTGAELDRIKGDWCVGTKFARLEPA